MGPLVWKRTGDSDQDKKHKDICIIHVYKVWWIGDYHDQTADYYVISRKHAKTAGAEFMDPHVPPLQGNQDMPVSASREPMKIIEAFCPILFSRFD